MYFGICSVALPELNGASQAKPNSSCAACYIKQDLKTKPINSRKIISSAIWANFTIWPLIKETIVRDHSFQKLQSDWLLQTPFLRKALVKYSSLRPLTIVLTNLKEMVCSAKEFSVR